MEKTFELLKKEERKLVHQVEIVQKVPYYVWIENETGIDLKISYRCDEQDKFSPYFTIILEKGG